jgi:PhnB protein
MSEVRLIPRLVVADAAAAIAFYRAAFGAAEVACHRGAEGRVVHAELSLGGAPLYLKDADAYDPVPQGPGALLSLYVPDSDAVFAAALSAGAEVVFPLQTQFYGERGGRLRDPFGYQWLVSTVEEQLSPEELDRRTSAWKG